MANVIHRTTLEYRRSVHTPDFDPVIWIINPDLSAVQGVSRKYWKIVGDNVVGMTQSERDAVDAAEPVSDEVVAIVTTPMPRGRLPFKEEHYAIDNGDGTYSKKVKEVECIYTGRRLTCKIERSMNAGGTARETKTFDYFTGDNGQIIEKRS